MDSVHVVLKAGLVVARKVTQIAVEYLALLVFTTLVTTEVVGLAGLEVTKVTAVLPIPFVHPDNVVFKAPLAVEASTTVVTYVIPVERTQNQVGFPKSN